MKKYLLYGISIISIIIIFAVIMMLTNPSTPTIKSDIFSINDWNHPEYIELNTENIQGTVIKEMKSESENMFDCIIERLNSYTGNTFLIYYVDTIQHPVGEVTDTIPGVKIGTYLYEESVDVVRTLPVYMSIGATKLYK